MKKIVLNCYFAKSLTLVACSIYLILITLSLTALISAQNIQSPEKKTDMMERGDFKVDPATGALSISIPIRVYTGRGGTSIPISFNYSSKVWQMDYDSYLNNSNCDYGPSFCTTNPITVVFPRFAAESSSGWTFSMQMPESKPDARIYDSNGRECDGQCLQQPNTRWVDRFYMKMPDGSSHEFRRDDGLKTLPVNNSSGVYYSVDGSGIRFELNSQTSTLFLPNGSRYVWEQPVNNNARIKYIDSNGNVLSYHGEDNGWTDTLNRLIKFPQFSLSPTEGDFNYTLPSLSGTEMTYSLKWRKLEYVRIDPSEPLRYTGDRNHIYNYFSPALFEANEENRFAVGFHNPVVLSEIILSDGQSYKFTYNVYGEIDKIVYPTGAYERYTYGAVPPTEHLSFPYDQTNRGVTARWVSPTGNSTDEQAWGYSYTNSSKTTQPDGTIIERYFHKGRNFQDPDLKYGFDDARSGKQYEEKFILPGNIVKSRSLTKWEQRGPTTLNNVTGHQAATRDPYISKEISIIFDAGNTNALMQMTEYEHDSNSDPTYFAHLNVKRTKVYDYVVIPKTTAETSDIAALESYFNGQTPSKIQETDYQYTGNYKARGINSLPIETRIKDGAGNVKAKSQISYDESNYLEAATVTNAPGWENPSTTYRGLPTSTRSWYDLANNQYIETHTSYDQFGNPRKNWDGRGNFSEIQYADNYTDNLNRSAYVLPTKTISYSGTNGTGTVFETSVKYDFNTGLPHYTTDANNQTSEIQYNDLLLRPTKTIAPNGHQIITQYGVPDSSGQLSASQRFVKVKTQIDANNWKEGYTWFDGLGRPVKSQSVDSSGDVFALTCYDSVGRVSKASNSFRNVSNASCSSTNLEWTSTTYDAAGRAWKVTTPDNAVVETNYFLATSGNQIGTVVLVKDQALKERRSITNAFGQLVRVDEPDVTNSNQLGSVAAPYQPTFYEYDPLNNLTKVKHGGSESSPTQLRTFAYDSLSRLKSATNPESGAISYLYDNNGNLTKKTDARLVETSYSYDALNRVITRSYANEPAGQNPTPAVTYYYDGVYFNAANQQQMAIGAVKGKLTSVSSSVSRTNYSEFDSLGRVLKSQQITDGAAYPEMTYSYNLSGALVEQKYPSGRVVKNVLDNDGDLSIVQSKKNQTAGFWNYADSFTYNASGAVTSMQLGNGRWESTVFNSRLQPVQIALGTVQNGTDKLKLNFTYNTVTNGNPNADNNGNVLSQTIVVPTEVRNSTTYNGFTATQTYTYDSLNRIKQATETVSGQSGNNWQQTFDYDRFGNRTFNEANTTASANFPKACSGAMCAPDKKIFNPQAQTSDNRFSTTDGYQHDSAGNTTRDAQSRKFTYDGENKQIKVETTDANGNVTGLLGEYWYDGDGKRVRKYSFENNQWITTIFVYDAAGKLVAEYANQISATQTVSYLTSDHLGSPRINTDQNGLVTARHDYHPFGEEIARASYETDAVRKQFTGYERDKETDLDFAQARMYSKNLGRFTTVDPLRSSAVVSHPQTFNRYSYVLNNPLILVDPTGENGEIAVDIDRKKKTGTVTITANFIIYNKDGRLNAADFQNEVRKYTNQVLGSYEGTFDKGGIKFTVETVFTFKTASSEADAISKVGDKGIDNIVGLRGAPNATTFENYNGTSGVVAGKAYSVAGEKFDRIVIATQDPDPNLGGHETGHAFGAKSHLEDGMPSGTIIPGIMSGSGPSASKMTQADFDYLFEAPIAEANRTIYNGVRASPTLYTKDSSRKIYRSPAVYGVKPRYV